MNPNAMPNAYPQPGEVIDGKYQIETILGEGGMGCVARAFHLLLRAPVALKFMNPQFMTFPGAVERFINEGIASKRIRSDHVVPVDDVGKLASGAPYLVMPCLEGMDLADLLARDGTPGLPVPRAVHFTLQILRGLQAAHAAGIIHRDMKPSNCFVVKHDGERDFVRILDFGISKVAQPGSASLTQTNSALGTPLYMSPEQARSPRDVDMRSDIYSVGVILYELLTGHTPFVSESGEFTEILFKLFTAEPPPITGARPDLDPALAAAVHKALAREVKDRFAAALEMAEAIAPFADERSANVVARMRGFSPEQVLSRPPPTGMPLPPSMVAFSALEIRPPTDLMANRPTTDVMKGPPVTALLENTPARPKAKIPAPPTESSPGMPPRVASTPPETATPQAEEPQAVAARTFAAKPGSSTDLGATRDAGDAGEKKRSPWIFIGPAVAALALVGGVVAMTQGPSVKTDPSTQGSAQGMRPDVPPKATETLPPPTTATATVAVTASAAANVADAAASAIPSASATTPKIKPPPTRTSRPPVDPLNPGIHE